MDQKLLWWWISHHKELLLKERRIGSAITALYSQKQVLIEYWRGTQWKPMKSTMKTREKLKFHWVPQISLLFHSPFHMKSYKIHCLWNYFHWSISLHFHWVSLGLPNENPIKINFHWVYQWNFNFSLGCSKIFIGFS